MDKDKNQEEALVKLIPLLPVSAEGVTLSSSFDAAMLKGCKMVQSHVEDAQFAMVVTGNSMTPEYPAGSMIYLKRINKNSFINWGSVYLLDTCNGRILKKLMPADDGNKDKLKCVSINPEYPSFEVGFENIDGIYRAIACVSLK